MRILASTVLFAIALLFPLSAASQAGNLWTDKPLLEREDRKALASDWKSTFSKLEAQIPYLSPSQRAWITKEYDDEIRSAGNRYTRRAIAATESLEYQLYVAKPRLAEIIRLLGELSGSSQPNQQAEVALWTELAYQLMEKQLWSAIDNLVQRKTIDRKVNGFDSYYYENHVLWGQMVLSRVTIPYLEGRLPQ